MLHTSSSQAGLASLRAGAPITFDCEAPPPRPTFIIRTQSGIVFELRKQAHAQAYAVIGSIGYQSTTAEAIVGMVFTPGDNPYWYARGYAQIVQQALNNRYNLHSAYGIAAPAEIITEIPAT